MMRISIITISFNQVAFIKEAIDSVLNQSYQDLEYIVVDAGSTDGSKEVIDSYGDRLVRIYEPDEGQADGLNKGLAKATGEVVGFVNSDDVLLPYALNEVNRRFGKSTDLDVLFGSGYKVDRDLNVIHDIYPDRFSTEKYARMNFNFIQTATFFKREAALNAGGFNIENRTCWDGELVAKLGQAGSQMQRTFKKLAAFRIYNESISGSGDNSVQYLEDRARIFSELTGKPKGSFLKDKNSLFLRCLNFVQTPQKFKVLIQKRYSKWMNKRLR